MEFMPVEKDVPIPKAASDKYLFGDLNKGDSRLYPYGDVHPMLFAHRLANAARVYGYRYNRKFTTRQTSKGVRVWRVM